jgi:hypothetical protein
MLRSLGALSVLGVLVATSMGCRQKAAPGAAAATVAPAAAQAALSNMWLVSVAAFDHDTLVECEDFSLLGTPRPDADATEGAAILRGIGDAVWKDLPNPGGSRTRKRLQHPCEEQFPDRRAFGTCSDLPNPNLDLNARTRRLHYAFADVFKSDVAMKACIAKSGTWNALSKESAELRAAQLRFEHSKPSAR